ncbi:MSB3 (YNL293W) and MSB4 (YOL112W) [Zygosaccharomyces parabailii]|uniref:BN860_11804g1_1 n=1 Tax=Zygosaccharomyces bailii (strain CLIB 213 / ATCC 58445 / CBS 680 / BCRC 21525 / NBRC 1098 / NCYC 1416 / NRRL Y-2227) TaxID=1333698 RepID=A0A8J2X5D0_ZYGB2|nr:MSB3 (YNL293W) and MSB4 (YOL112W) [Zygosaccharomyces parabailii]CDF87670.1 BN860_11804g1_1 [Zygosaccharomyces bailii CLIB 213]
MEIERLRHSINHGPSSGQTRESAKGNGYPKKSPSMPNFHEKPFSSSNISEPVLNATVDSEHLSNISHVPSLTEGDASLSVIEMYGDEVESRRPEGNELDEEDEADSDDGELHNTAIPPTASIIPDSQYFDRYGFKKQSNFITEEEYNEWWEEYSQYCIRRKHKWKLFLEKSGLPMDNDSPNRFPSRSEKLKRYVRKGIPAEWRGNAWWYFARGQDKLNKNRGIYDKLLLKMDDLLKSKSKSLPDLDIIERDLNRTFPDNIHFQKETFQVHDPPMIKSLRRVLVAFSLYNPKIGYCQSMNFLAGLLLLFMDEERAFWMLVIITSRYLPGVHNVNLEGVNVDQGVLMLCVKEYLPEIWQYLVPPLPKHHSHSSFSGSSPSSLGNNDFLYKLPPITLCTASWFMSCFVGILPVEGTLRVWDCLFYEESHFLFKASLAIFKLCEPELMQLRPLKSSKSHNGGQRGSSMSNGESEMEVFQVIQTFPKQMINPNDIFDKVIFKRRVSLNKLDQDEVDRCRKYVASQRLKYKHYSEIMGTGHRNNTNGIGIASASPTTGTGDNRDSKMAGDIINDALSSEVYGFKKGLSGVHWNNSIKAKVKQMRKKKG